MSRHRWSSRTWAAVRPQFGEPKSTPLKPNLMQKDVVQPRGVLEMREDMDVEEPFEVELEVTSKQCASQSRGGDSVFATSDSTREISIG